MKLISTPAAHLFIGLIWLASVSSAEAAKIVLLDDPCQPQQIWWDLGPAGIGSINIRLDLVLTDDCEEINSNYENASGPGGGFGNGGGIIGGFPSGGSSGSITPPSGAFAGDGPFVLTTPSDLGDLPPSFTGDPPPFGDGNDTTGIACNDTPGIIGGSLGLLLTTYPLLSDDDFGPDDSDDEGPNDQSIAVVPEPGSFLLLGTGLALAVRRFRRR